MFHVASSCQHKAALEYSLIFITSNMLFQINDIQIQIPRVLLLIARLPVSSWDYVCCVVLVWSWLSGKTTNTATTPQHQPQRVGNLYLDSCFIANCLNTPYTTKPCLSVLIVIKNTTGWLKVKASKQKEPLKTPCRVQMSLTFKVRSLPFTIISLSDSSLSL